MAARRALSDETQTHTEKTKHHIRARRFTSHGPNASALTCLCCPSPSLAMSGEAVPAAPDDAAAAPPPDELDTQQRVDAPPEDTSGPGSVGSLTSSSSGPPSVLGALAAAVSNWSPRTSLDGAATITQQAAPEDGAGEQAGDKQQAGTSSKHGKLFHRVFASSSSTGGDGGTSTATPAAAPPPQTPARAKDVSPSTECASTASTPAATLPPRPPSASGVAASTPEPERKALRGFFVRTRAVFRETEI